MKGWDGEKKEKRKEEMVSKGQKAMKTKSACGLSVHFQGHLFDN